MQSPINLIDASLSQDLLLLPKHFTKIHPKVFEQSVNIQTNKSSKQTKWKMSSLTEWKKLQKYRVKSRIYIFKCSQCSTVVTDSRCILIFISITTSITRTSRSSDKLLLFVPKMTLALSAKVFTVSAHSIWNSLSYKCRSAELLSTFKRTLKTELFDIAYSEREHSA